MEDPFLRKWFEDQLKFRLRDGTEAESIFLGASELFPVEVAKEFDVYEQEFINWRSEIWKPEQHGIREEILRNYGNRNRYDDLIDAVRRQQAVPLVGSGMSVPSGLPTWGEFLVRTGEYAQCDDSELDRLICCSAFEEAADLLSTSMNSILFAERVEHNLRVSDPDSISGPVCLLPKLFPNFVITTNLDNVLEDLYKSCGVPFERNLSGKGIANYRQLKNPEERFLIKLHGDCRDQDGRVLLSQEYDEAYSANSLMREEIVLLCRLNSLLFLGCSLGPDRTVKLIHEIALADTHMPKHYAFLVKPDDDVDRIARENFLTERGIFPIWYDLPHDESIMALLDGLDAYGTQ